MPSTFEGIMGALVTLIDGAVAATVVRGAALPQAVPAGGLVILRSETGSPEPVEITLSPVRYAYDHPVTLELYVQDRTAAERDAGFDALKVAIGTAIGGDRTLGGLCDWVEMSPPEENDEPFQGANPIKTGIVPLTISYHTSNPLT